MPELPVEPLGVEDAARLEVLLGDVRRLRGTACTSCRAALNAHEAVIAVAMGFRSGARCVNCFVLGLGQERAVFLDRALEHLRRRPCFWGAWRYAGDIEGMGPVERPLSLWPDRSQHTAVETMTENSDKTNAPVAHDATWDAGGMGCGDLVLELRLRMKALSAGQVLMVSATDPGAPEDIPAWCGMTGHTLIHVNHPQYWIKRREE